MKPCKEWDIYHINWLTGFVFHQQYLYLQLNSPWFWSTPRWRGLSRCLEVGNKISLRGVCYLSGGVKRSCFFLLILMNFDWFWDQVGEDFARFCGACPQHERPRAQIWVTLVEGKLVWFLGWLAPPIPLEWCQFMRKGRLWARDLGESGLHGVGESHPKENRETLSQSKLIVLRGISLSEIRGRHFEDGRTQHLRLR